MLDSNSLIGMPWQLAKSRLQAAHIPFKVMIGGSFNRFFDIADKGLYVARITKVDECLHILVYRPMIASDFGNSIEVDYAKELFNRNHLIRLILIVMRFQNMLLLLWMAMVVGLNEEGCHDLWGTVQEPTY